MIQTILNWLEMLAITTDNASLINGTLHLIIAFFILIIVAKILVIVIMDTCLLILRIRHLGLFNIVIILVQLLIYSILLPSILFSVLMYFHYYLQLTY